MYRTKNRIKSLISKTLSSMSLYTENRIHRNYKFKQEGRNFVTASFCHLIIGITEQVLLLRYIFVKFLSKQKKKKKKQELQFKLTSRDQYSTKTSQKIMITFRPAKNT